MIKIRVDLLKERVRKILEEDIPKLEALERRYEVEIRRAEAGTHNYSGMSEAERNSVKESLEKQKKYLSDYRSGLNSTCEEMNKLFDDRDKPDLDVAARNDIDSKLQEKKAEQDKLKRNFESIKQGKTADVISANLGSIDKRIHNRLYAKNNRRWEKHKAAVQNRYDHPSANLKYAISRGAIVGVLAVSSVGAMLVNPVFGGMVIAGAIGYGAKVVENVVSTIYNRRKFGGPPKFVQKYNILKGRAANVEKAKSEREIAKNLMTYYYEAMSNPVPARPATPTPTPRSESSDATDELADLLTRLNTLTDDGLNNTDENYIENTLKPLYEGLHSHEADIPASARAKYDRLKTKITNYENDKRILQEVTNELNALTVTEVNDANYESIKNLCDKARPCAARLPEDLRNKYTDLVNKLNTYEANKRELEGITNSLNTYATQDITEENIEEIREFYNRARARVADLSEAARNKLSIIGNKLRNYGSRRVDDDSQEYLRVASEIDNLGRNDLVHPEEEDILFSLFPIYRAARNFEGRFKEDTLIKYNILKKICLDYIKSRENRHNNTASNELDVPTVDETVDNEIKEPNIDDYGNLNLGMIDISDEYKKNRLPFSEAISAARRIDVQDASDEDLERKIAGYDRLYKSLGTGRPNNNTTPNSQLSDYNRTLKQLAEYGRKVHSGKATTKEKNAYVALLYHLGKDDEFITTFLEDECDRYMADRAEFEERRRK